MHSGSEFVPEALDQEKFGLNEKSPPVARRAQPTILRPTLFLNLEWKWVGQCLGVEQSFVKGYDVLFASQSVLPYKSGNYQHIFLHYPV
jgi:hypothetical protein